MSTARASELLATWPDEFLADYESRTWRNAKDVPTSIRPAHLFLQPVENGLEVAAATSATKPKAAELRKAWKARQGGRAAPLLLAVGYATPNGLKVAACGPVGDEPLVLFDLDDDRVERVAAAALGEPNRHCAQRSLLRALQDVESELLGLVNGGLVATHELKERVPDRRDWSEATMAARPLLKLRGRDLVKGLGYSIDTLTADASLLTVGKDQRAVAVFLDDHELHDTPGVRFNGSTPVSRAIALASQHDVPWVVMTRAAEIRLYAATPSIGIGRKSGEATFVEVNLRLLPESLAGYLKLLFSADALSPQGSLDQIVEQSADYAVDLASRLRERVYRDAVPALAHAVAARLASDPDETMLAATYDQALNILFRLLFVAYGEDKGLLPYRTNEMYTEHSIKRIAHSLLGTNYAAPIGGDDDTDLWDRMTKVWKVIDKGNDDWGVPPYNGGLFSADGGVGAALARLRLSNAELRPALEALLVDVDEQSRRGPVDFRSLSVREFGTIYEGLLESSLSVATSDLTVDGRGTYVPATKGQPPVVRAGEVYLHNRSGARKATGSYFTKPFAVDHLLDHALEPALDEHIARIRAHLGRGDEASAAEEFFDFRCADIAMGSGHFLVAAIDRIEAKLSALLALEPIPAVARELHLLRQVALRKLGPLADGVEIETTSLLRRQVARRCIYGVDRNEISVELARLAVWIHTFVPGLPLSFLDHNLVPGDSLTGIGTIDEALAVLPVGTEKKPTLFREAIQEYLNRSAKALSRLGTIADADVDAVKESEQAHEEARKAVEPAAALFDLIVAERLGEAEVPLVPDEATILDAAAKSGARKTVAGRGALHFPIAFPEVFLRERSGFDCILGNPPWEKVKVEEHQFWGLRFPGLRSLPVAKMNAEITRLRSARPDLAADLVIEQEAVATFRKLLAQGPLSKSGGGDPDLYRLFAWRFWQLVGTGGCVGVVLPRAALASSGMTAWRLAVLEGGDFMEVTVGTNTGGWMFDDAEHRYTICFASIRKTGRPGDAVLVHGPYRSLGEYRTEACDEGVRLPAEGLRTWTSGAAFPLIPSGAAGAVFTKLRRRPRLDSTNSFRFRPVMCDLHATAGKEHMIFEPDDKASLWPVYKGATFNLWRPEGGDVYAWVEPSHIRQVLLKKRRAARPGSALAEANEQWSAHPSSLPCDRPRIAFRDVARATDSRTVICALVPPNVVVTHKAPYLLRINGDACDDAFLLGVMSSLPFDWYARRFVENSVTFDLLNGFPVPDVVREDKVRRRVEQIAGRLAAVDRRYKAWAAEVDVPVGSVVDEDEKVDLLAELDAAVAVLYGLDADDLRVIYETFHEGADYSERCERVLAHHRRLS